jgi:hypothetical protein
MQGVTCDIFLSDFRSRILYVGLIFVSTICATRHVCFIFINFFILTILNKKYRLLNCYWSSPAQLFLVPSPTGLMTIMSDGSPSLQKL